MSNFSRLELLDYLGFRKDPFRTAGLGTNDGKRIQRILSMAIQARAMVSIVGERGVGKTRAVKDALKSLRVRTVLVRSSDKARLMIGGIEGAMILDLSEEKPKRGGEIRARQLRRVLGEASRNQKIVLVIEEAHRLHGQTLRALKCLRELTWMGETELFTVVLLGQSDPMNKGGVAEVRLRSDTIHMKGLTENEIAGYIQSAVGAVFAEEAINAVALLPEAKNFLNLQNILVKLMGRAVAADREEVSLEDVADEFGSGPNKMSKAAISADVRAAKKETPQGGNESLKSVLGHQGKERIAAVG